MNGLAYRISQGIIQSEELYFSLINYSVLSDEEHINQDDETPRIARKQRDKNLALSKVN